MFYYGTGGGGVRLSWLASRMARRNGSVLYLWSEEASAAWDRVRVSVDRPPETEFVAECVAGDVTVHISQSVERFTRAKPIEIGYRLLLRPGFVASTGPAEGAPY